MNAVAKIKADVEVTADPLAKLREPFPDHQVSKLPKETGAQAKQRKADQESGKWPAKCSICEGYHHPKAVHLDYVGHAALTDRLLDTDSHWSWEPVAFRDGLPAFDATGGLWIRLTVCGVTRLGYGHAALKPQMDPGSREKEVIGDALRNAAMRFGAALDLWHKGDLHKDDEGETDDEPKRPLWITAAESAIIMLRSAGACEDWWRANKAAFEGKPKVEVDQIIDLLGRQKANFKQDEAKAAEARFRRDGSGRVAGGGAGEVSPFDALQGDTIPF